MCICMFGACVCVCVCVHVLCVARQAKKPVPAACNTNTAAPSDGIAQPEDVFDENLPRPQDAHMSMEDLTEDSDNDDDASCNIRNYMQNTYIHKRIYMENGGSRGGGPGGMQEGAGRELGGKLEGRGWRERRLEKGREAGPVMHAQCEETNA